MPEPQPTPETTAERGAVPDQVAQAALLTKLGIEFLEATAEKVVARMPIEGNTQPLGMLHGGASAALAETVASYGGWLAATPGQLVLGLEIKCNHLRPARAGWLTATGVPVHVGRTTQLWEIRLTNEEDKLVAFATCTLAVREMDAQPGTPDGG
ncbi:MAG TPA: PaaI family thioesterase [Actinomycetota bacterium]|nr:PaaI family thioesterase [Actinomycetota bacterium]